MDLSRGFLELQSAFEGSDSKFVNLSVKGLGFLVQLGFERNCGSWQLGLHEKHPFDKVVENYKDFAFSEYARVGRELALYEVGDREQAIAEVEDVSISLKGYPEIHAALAAALYVDKHSALLAENQFTIATLLDLHYTDISYVKDTKHWPPSLDSSLKHFITLS